MSTKHQHHDSKPREMRNYSRGTMYLLDFRPLEKKYHIRILALLILTELLSGVKITMYNTKWTH